MSSGNRSPQTRNLAMRAFAQLLSEVGEHWRDLVLIGGLVPETLVDTDELHQGTLDVDILLSLAPIYDREDDDFGWLEAALHRAGFLLVEPDTGWRWMLDLDGNPVIVEFLVDVPDNPGQQIALPGADDLAAQNLAGPGPALHDSRELMIDGRRGRVVDVGGYLVAKARAVLWRGKSKDLYDFAYVIVHRLAADGPALAAKVAMAATPDPALPRDLLADVRSACDLFGAIDSVGARAYAAGAVDAGVRRPLEDLAEDARRAVSALKLLLRDG